MNQEIRKQKKESYFIAYRFCILLMIMIFLCTKSTVVRAASFVKQHGALSVSGTYLVDEKGKKVQLCGVSTHGLAWFPQYVNKEAFQTMRDQWNITVVRLALYTEEYGGYCTVDKENQKSLEKLIDDGVSYAKELGLYVILDWHILSDGNPNTHLTEAKQFFKKMAKKYDGCDNVIFEICNEPNGETSWDEIKSYAKKILKVIRTNQKKSQSIVIIGTPNWSQDVDTAAKNPIEDDHVMYALHFYAATHGSIYREKLQVALNLGLPVFVSEFGICDASGNGAVDKKEANLWKKFLIKNKISMCAWNLSNKEESSALIKSNCSKNFGWKLNDLSVSGKWVVKVYQAIAK